MHLHLDLVVVAEEKDEKVIDEVDEVVMEQHRG
jgi:hypothetical protein